MMTTMAPEHPVLNRPGDPLPSHAKTGFWTLTLGSIGVVYGDIGTSPSTP
jgi:KUP system potassium uptake protein